MLVLFRIILGKMGVRRTIVQDPHPYNKIGDGPEGPEVRTVADKLRPVLTGQTILHYTIVKTHKLVGFEYLRLPATITTVTSYGKKVIIHLDCGQSLIISLGMSGRLQYHDGGHTHVRFDLCRRVSQGLLSILEHNGHLYYDQARPFAGIDVLDHSHYTAYFADLGPDLLACAQNVDTWITFEQWSAIFTSPKIAQWQVCKALLEQSLVAGIGNYLKSEILYYAGILPQRLMSSLSTDDLERLRVSAHQVIQSAYSYGGLTIKDYISPDGQPGIYPVAVYGKDTDSRGYPVTKGKTKDGRMSHWVEAVQR